jgi:prevent-host-death family protein
MQVSLEEIKTKLGSIIARVEKGEEIILLRRGKEIARIVPPKRDLKPLPSLKEFRASIRVSGEPLSDMVVRMRDLERY